MSTGLDEILARSRAPGAFVERRTFTLSRGKALEKQREFALRHPAQYVLELVQSAVFADATYLALDARADSMLLAWVGGRPFQRNELENVLDWLFWDRGDQTHRHLVQLAVGVNALLQRKPKLLRIESGDGTTSVRLDLDAAGNATVGTPQKPIAGTYVHAVHTIGWLQRFMGSGPVDEIDLVERRCSYLPVPILVNGGAPFGYRASRHLEVFGAAHQRSFDEDGRRGVVALVGNRTHASAVAGFRMVVGGVWVSTLPLDQMCGKVPLSGVLCDDRLRKTADQSDVVQDARFLRLLHAVQPIAGELVTSALGAQAWRPPRLPPIPEEVQEAPAPEVEAPAEPVVELEPIPDMVPAIAPRFAVGKEHLGARGEGPLFRVDPAQAEQLAEALAPHRFPWCVVVLNDGQAATLARTFEEAVPPKLATRADVDFVTRALERSIVTRDHLERVDGDELIVRLHLEGPLPDWGLGRPGVPFCVVGPEGTIEHGVLREGRAELAGGAGDAKDRELVGPPLDLPRISLLLRTERRDGKLGSHHVQDAREAARLLVGDASAPSEQALLAALLGDRAIPQLVAGPDGPTLAIAPPPGWSPGLADLPLPGGITLRDMAATVERGEVLRVRDGDGLPGVLEPLERKLGFGHLAPPSLRRAFVAGVARSGGAWREIDFGITDIGQVAAQALLVTATLEGLAPEGFDVEQRFGETIIGVTTAGVVGEDWEGGRRALLFELQQRLEDRSLLRPRLSADRCEGMGRLAVLELAEQLGETDIPVLVPTDGGGRRSLNEIRTHAAARAVARHGIRIAEPWTFAVTLDELRRIRLDGTHAGPALRYDDDPDVWHDLPQGELGWLLREDFRVGGLKGWLGLRIPFDPTTGILLRTTGALVALSDLERTLPCHGLVWPASGQELHAEQRRLVQLAGWRLYQQLVAVLDERGSAERAETARHYASAFVALAWERSKQLQGTAAELARRVPVEGVGSLLDWYEGGHAAGAAEEVVAPPDAPVVARAVPDLQDRLAGAFPLSGLLVSVVEVSGGHRAAPVELGSESQRAHAQVVINADHPLCVAALASGGPAREILLLEAARVVAQGLRVAGRESSIGVAHQLLVGQRFDPT
ncbi:MAG: hypothetical protein KC621_25500 [Myxococcales bacterium]|nr:hypothetical protein [Myxococcales bacterium]